MRIHRRGGRLEAQYEKTARSRMVGASQILGSGVCFGFLGVFGKAGYESGLKPGEFLALRFAFAAAIMWAWRFASPAQRRAPSLSSAEVLRCAALGVLGYAVFSSCYFQALKGLSASLTVLLLYAYPPLVTLGAWLFLRERPKAQAIWALPLAAAGLLFLVKDDLRADNATAFAFGLLAALFYSVYILASSKWLKGAPALSSTRWIQTFAALALSALYLRDPGRDAQIIAAAWPSLVGVAAISTVGAMAFFLAGLRRLTSSEASLLSLGEPIAGLALNAFALGDRMSPAQATGGAMVLAALALVAWPGRSPSLRRFGFSRGRFDLRRLLAKGRPKTVESVPLSRKAPPPP